MVVYRLSSMHPDDYFFRGSALVQQSEWRPPNLHDVQTALEDMPLMA